MGAFLTGSGIPPGAGVGLKPQHAPEILSGPQAVAFFEVHAENYMGAGGAPHALLTRIRADYPLSLHGVGLSIGGEGPLDQTHLQRLRDLVRRYEPGLFSEHLAWSSHETQFFNDLLPVPYTQATLARVIDHIDQVQEVLGRQMLLENPSTYLAFEASEMSEVAFLRAVAKATGCGLLLDVNNVYVSAQNQNFDPQAYLGDFPFERVGEIHLAGHFVDSDAAGAPLLIDAHGCPVADPVWSLYRAALERLGPVPTLIEWDNDVPEWSVLLAEAETAARVMNGVMCTAKKREVAHA